MSSQPTVTSLLRGLEVLRCFNDSRRSLGSSEIARLTGLPQPTVWRLCETLKQAGYLTTEPGDTKFQLGLSVLTLGFAALSTLDLTELVSPHLQQVATTFRAAASLTTRERFGMLCLQRFEEPNAALTVGFRVGTTVPIANSGVGWAYLSGLPPPRRAALIAQVQRRDPDTWRKVQKAYDRAMRDFEANGYIVNADIIYPGLTTVAVSVLRPSDQTLFVLNCTALSALLTPNMIKDRVGPRMRDIGERVSAALASTKNLRM